jgi:hypothetical protein
MTWRDPCPMHNAKRCRWCRCPKCKRGIMLEWRVGWWCSRRYAKKDACDYEVAVGLLAATRAR